MNKVALSLIAVMTLVSAPLASIRENQLQQPPQSPSPQTDKANQAGSNANANRQQSQQGNQSKAVASINDRKFEIDASEADMAELANAQLALQRAESDDVKQFAQRVINDRTKANQELTQLATSKGFPLP